MFVFSIIWWDTSKNIIAEPLDCGEIGYLVLSSCNYKLFVVTISLLMYLFFTLTFALLKLFKVKFQLFEWVIGIMIWGVVYSSSVWKITHIVSITIYLLALLLLTHYLYLKFDKKAKK